MSTAVAAPVGATSLAPSPPHEQSATPRQYAAIAPSNGSAPPPLNIVRTPRPHSNNASPTSGDGPQRTFSSDSRQRLSPTSGRGSGAPKIIVKKEPASPEPSARHRPERLNLSKSIPSSKPALSARPSAPMTSKDSAGLALQDVGLACLSPGFQTHDPTMREQLQRSLDVREQQRQIIEARQKGHKIPNGESRPSEDLRNGQKTPVTSRRKGPPPGLSINAPSHQQFANERVIQSAPLGQSFTGLQGRNIQPLSRQVVNQPSSLSQTSHIHHVAAQQTNNRLPPISDVFAGESLAAPARNYNNSPGHSWHSNNQPPLPSPGFPPAQQQQQQQQPGSARPREYKSAEEAVQSLSGGREDLLPRLVHYGGHQPPTPPSPMPKHNSNGQPYHQPAHSSSTGDLHRSTSARRRGRDEYERDMGTPPLQRMDSGRRPGPFGEGRDSPETQRKKKEEFIALCARAWDLFHS